MCELHPRVNADLENAQEGAETLRTSAPTGGRRECDFEHDLDWQPRKLELEVHKRTMC